MFINKSYHKHKIFRNINFRYNKYNENYSLKNTIQYNHCNRYKQKNNMETNIYDNIKYKFVTFNNYNKFNNEQSILNYKNYERHERNVSIDYGLDNNDKINTSCKINKQYIKAKLDIDINVVHNKKSKQFATITNVHNNNENHNLIQINNSLNKKLLSKNKNCHVEKTQKKILYTFNNFINDLNDLATMINKDPLYFKKFNTQKNLNGLLPENKKEFIIINNTINVIKQYVMKLFTKCNTKNIYLVYQDFSSLQSNKVNQQLFSIENILLEINKNPVNTKAFDISEYQYLDDLTSNILKSNKHLHNIESQFKMPYTIYSDVCDYLINNLNVNCDVFFNLKIYYNILMNVKNIKNNNERIFLIFICQILLSIIKLIIGNISTDAIKYKHFNLNTCKQQWSKMKFKLLILLPELFHIFEDDVFVLYPLIKIFQLIIIHTSFANLDLNVLQQSLCVFKTLYLKYKISFQNWDKKNILYKHIIDSTFINLNKDINNNIHNNKMSYKIDLHLQLINMLIVDELTNELLYNIINIFTFLHSNKFNNDLTFNNVSCDIINILSNNLLTIYISFNNAINIFDHVYSLQSIFINETNVKNLNLWKLLFDNMNKIYLIYAINNKNIINPSFITSTLIKCIVKQYIFDGYYFEISTLYTKIICQNIKYLIHNIIKRDNLNIEIQNELRVKKKILFKLLYYNIDIIYMHIIDKYDKINLYFHSFSNIFDNIILLLNTFTIFASKYNNDIALNSIFDDAIYFDNNEWLTIDLQKKISTIYNFICGPMRTNFIIKNNFVTLFQNTRYNYILTASKMFLLNYDSYFYFGQIVLTYIYQYNNLNNLFFNSSKNVKDDKINILNTIIDSLMKTKNDVKLISLVYKTLLFILTKINANIDYKYVIMQKLLQYLWNKLKFMLNKNFWMKFLQLFTEYIIGYNFECKYFVYLQLIIFIYDKLPEKIQLEFSLYIFYLSKYSYDAEYIENTNSTNWKYYDKLYNKIKYELNCYGFFNQNKYNQIILYKSDYDKLKQYFLTLTINKKIYNSTLNKIIDESIINNDNDINNSLTRNEIIKSDNIPNETLDYGSLSDGSNEDDYIDKHNLINTNNKKINENLNEQLQLNIKQQCIFNINKKEDTNNHALKIKLNHFINGTIILQYLYYLYQNKLNPVKQNNIFIMNDQFYTILSVSIKNNKYQNIKEHLLRYIKRINVFQLNMLLIPICYANHWSLMTLVKINNIYQLFYYDSLWNDINIKHICQYIKLYLHDVKKIKYNNLDVNISKLNVIKVDVPQQTNNYDCGIYLLMFAEILLNNCNQNNFNWCQDKLIFNQIKPININTKRQEINYLLQNSLLTFNDNIINNCQRINYKTHSIINKVEQILDKNVTNRPKLLINNNIIKNKPIKDCKFSINNNNTIKLKNKNNMNNGYNKQQIEYNNPITDVLQQEMLNSNSLIVKDNISKKFIHEFIDINDLDYGNNIDYNEFNDNYELNSENTDCMFATSGISPSTDTNYFKNRRKRLIYNIIPIEQYNYKDWDNKEQFINDNYYQKCGGKHMNGIINYLRQGNYMSLLLTKKKQLNKIFDYNNQKIWEIRNSNSLKRHTIILGIKSNIYGQADIMDVLKVSKSFLLKKSSYQNHKEKNIDKWLNGKDFAYIYIYGNIIKYPVPIKYKHKSHWMVWGKLKMTDLLYDSLIYNKQFPCSTSHYIPYYVYTGLKHDLSIKDLENELTWLTQCCLIIRDSFIQMFIKVFILNFNIYKVMENTTPLWVLILLGCLSSAWHLIDETSINNIRYIENISNPINLKGFIKYIINDTNIQFKNYNDNLNFNSIKCKLLNKLNSPKIIKRGSLNIYEGDLKECDDRRHCYFCNGSFKNKTSMVDIRCMYCAKRVYRFHLRESIIIGKYRSKCICPHCITLDEWQQIPCNDNYETLTEFTFVYTKYGIDWFSFIPKRVNIHIYIQEEWIPQRFFSLLKSESQKKLSNRKKLYFKFIGFKYTNVRWNNFKTKIQWELYLQRFESQYTPTSVNLLFPNEKVDIGITDIGNIKFNGFIDFNKLFHYINGADELFKEIQNLIDKYVILKNEKIDNMPLYQQHCNSIIRHPTCRGFSLYLNYKGWKSCAQGVFNNNKNIQSTILSNIESNGLTEYYKLNDLKKLKAITSEIIELKNKNNFNDKHKKKLKKIKKNKKSQEKLMKPKKTNLKVTKSLAQDYINKYCPKLLDLFKILKWILCILHYTIAQFHPALAYNFTQFLDIGIIDGEELLNVDFLQYLKGHYVESHRDHILLLINYIQFFGPFGVIKASKNSNDEILCNGAIKGNKCCNIECDELNIEWGGHRSQPGYTVYFMFNLGAAGGVTHCLHGHTKEGAKGLFQGFLDDNATTIVFRPQINDILRKWIINMFNKYKQ